VFYCCGLSAVFNKLMMMMMMMMIFWLFAPQKRQCSVGRH